MNDPSVMKHPVNRSVAALVLFVGMFMFAYTVPLASPVKPQIAETFGLADATATAPMFTTYLLAWFIVIPPCGYLADRFGRKVMLLAGSLVLSLGMLALSFVPTLAEWVRPTVDSLGLTWDDPQLHLALGCVSQFLVGAGAIILQIVGAAVVTDLFAEKRGSVLNIAVGAVGMLGMLSPMLMVDLVGRDVPWYLVYRYSALLPLVAFFAQLFCKFPAAAEAAPAELKASKPFAIPLLGLMVLGMFAYGIIEQGVSVWCSSYVEELGADTAWHGAVVSAYWITMSLVRVIVGTFGLFEKVAYPTIIVVCSILGAICLGIVTSTENAKLAVVFLGIFGGVIALIWPSIMTHAVQITGKSTATVFGVVVGLGGATGAMLGSFMPGVLKSLSDEKVPIQKVMLSFEVPLIVLVLMFGVMLMVKRRPAPASLQPQEA